MQSIEEMLNKEYGYDTMTYNGFVRSAHPAQIQHTDLTTYIPIGEVFYEME